MIEIPILKDIRDYKAKQVGPFTVRELIGFGIGIAGSYAGYFIQTNILGLEQVQGFLCFLLAIPGFAFGWIKPFGLNLEVFLKTAFISNVLSPRKRKFKTENDTAKYIDKVMKDVLKEEEKKLSKKEKKKKEIEIKKAKKKKCKDFLPYK